MHVRLQGLAAILPHVLCWVSLLNRNLQRGRRAHLRRDAMEFAHDNSSHTSLGVIEMRHVRDRQVLLRRQDICREVFTYQYSLVDFLR